MKFALPGSRRTWLMIAVLTPLIVVFAYVALRSGPLAPVPVTLVTVNAPTVSPTCGPLVTSADAVTASPSTIATATPITWKARIAETPECRESSLGPARPPPAPAARPEAIPRRTVV